MSGTLSFSLEMLENDSVMTFNLRSLLNSQGHLAVFVAKLLIGQLM